MAVDTLLLTSLTSALAAFANIWIYFQTHWWLAGLFLTFNILIWTNKTKVDNVNYYYSLIQKRNRLTTEVSSYILGKNNHIGKL